MRLLLCGGGSGNDTIEANKVFNSIIDHTKEILYVPLAMESERYPSCLEWFKGEMSEVDVSGIKMVESASELASLNLNDYAAIFIGGGNTFKLLNDLKKSGAFEKIREYILNNGIVYGGSAGAIIFGYDINSVSAMDDNEINLTDTKGFDVLNGYSIFAHYGNGSSKLTPEENEMNLQKYTDSINAFTTKIGPVIALPEEDTIYINGETVSIIGNKPYFTFNEAEMIEHTTNDELDIKKTY